MLNNLKKMFAPTVEFVDYEDGLLTVRTSKKLGEKNTSVKLKTTKGTLYAEISVESYDEANGVYRLRLYDHEMILDQLDFERRGGPRLLKIIRITSPSFPGFAGMTEDISVSGVRVTTTGPVEVVLDIQVKMELDDPELPPIDCYADVAWTSAKLDGSYHSGLRFQAMTTEQSRAIRRYIEDRIAMEKKLHTLEG